MVDTERSWLNVNVLSLSLLVEEEQVIQANQEYFLQVTVEAQEESVELRFSQYMPTTNLFSRLTCRCATPFPPSPSS